MNIFERITLFMIAVLILVMNIVTAVFFLMNSYDLFTGNIGSQYDDRFTFILLTISVNGVFIILTPQAYHYKREHEPVMRVEYPLSYVAPSHLSFESYFFKDEGHMYTRLSDGLYLVTNDFSGNFLLKKVRESK